MVEGPVGVAAAEDSIPAVGAQPARFQPESAATTRLRRRRKKIIRPAREKKHTLARIEYVLFLGIFNFFRLLPFYLAFRIGEGIGRLLYYLDRPHRKVGLKNLAIAFPEKNKAEHLRILYASFLNLGRLLAEFCQLRGLTPENIRDRVEFENEAEWLQLVGQLSGSGALILTGHFGNWELLAHAAACYGLPLHIIHRRLHNVFIEKAITQERERSGTKVIKKTTAGLEVLRAIKKKSIVVAAVDQNASGRMGVFVPFFSRLASTSSGLAGLALGTGVPVVPAFLIRDQGSCKHKIVILPLIEPVQTGNHEEDLSATTAKFTASFQHMVEQYPDHWLWIHKRWKRRPDGEAPIYT